MLKDILQKMTSGEIYDPTDMELLKFQLSRIQMVNDYNATPSGVEHISKREGMLKEMLRSCGDGCYIEPPFHANLGCFNVSLGSYVYVNFNLTLTDDGAITVGDRVMIGPNVTIVTACHPISPDLRAKGLQYNLPVTINDNVWIGAGAIILPGVTIGENSVIGAGSVVTKDIPANVVAVGNPCKVIREINESDYKTYDHGKPIPNEFFNK